MNPSGTKDRHGAKGASRTTDRTGAEAPAGLDFIRQIVSEDLRAGKHEGRVHTRFPPEPNGYLHIGHAKSICLNFGVASKFGGVCNVRFDDTNPETEALGYVTAIKDDVRWLGFEWGDREFYASDYFEQLYQYAVQLIKAGKAYVDSLKPDEVRAYRGGWNEPGKHSPDRDRSVEENLDLFTRMRAGEFEDGSLTLRAKIDMAASNMNMRDPTIYRIRRLPHYRTGHDWCIYPMYDFTHCLSDSIEGITHSLCTLEFEDHRPALRLVSRRAPRGLPSPADRVRAPQSQLHGSQQTETAGVGRWEARKWLGRSPDAHHGWAAPARLRAGGDPRVLRPHRRGQE